MQILLIGSGAREHAIAKAIVRSKDTKLLSYMGANNPGIIKLSSEWTVGDICHVEQVVKWAKEYSAELAVVGPEAPLNAGIVDSLLQAGIPCAGPTKDAAMIECDKSFSRNLMKKHGIPGCPKFGVFSDADEASAFIGSLVEVVVKPAGLTGGKGVKIMGPHLKDKGEAKAYASEVLDANIGALGSVVIEEKLIGQEFTLQAFVDGERVVPMPAVQDHKLAFEGDKGPNTGGMGSYSDAGLLPFITQNDYEQGIEIMKKTVDALASEGRPYKGFLYGQFIAGKKGIHVIEFNARLGDPEAMNVLSLLKTDFAMVLSQMANGNLASAEFSKKATVCKYLVPEGYPSNPKRNEQIQVDEESINSLGAEFFYASVDKRGKNLFELGSRTVAVLGIADSISEAEGIAEKATSFVTGPLFHRKDIGTSALVQKRIDHMRELRADKC
ncbi:MAG: phosphoribosylamine--glycine ligase [Candidatus Micrarchaeota archaeon]